VSSPEEKLDDAYWRRYDAFNLRRRLPYAWIFFTPIVVFGPKVLIPSVAVADALPAIVVPWFFVGSILIIRSRTAKCPKCSEAFFLRNLHYSGFADRCLHCQHELP
jgi:hypothetical protein